MVDKAKTEVVIDRKKSDVVGIVVWLISTGIAIGIQILVHGRVVIYPSYLISLVVLLPIALHEPLHFLGFLMGGINKNDLVLKRYKGLLPQVRPRGIIEVGVYIKAVLLPNVIVPLIFFVMVMVSDLIIYSLTFGLAIFMTAIDLYVIKGLKSFGSGCRVGCLENEFGFYME